MPTAPLNAATAIVATANAATSNVATLAWSVEKRQCAESRQRKAGNGKPATESRQRKAGNGKPASAATWGDRFLIASAFFAKVATSLWQEKGRLDFWTGGGNLWMA
jgi:hypothetical protein